MNYCWSEVVDLMLLAYYVPGLAAGLPQQTALLYFCTRLLRLFRFRTIQTFLFGLHSILCGNEILQSKP